MDEMPCFNWPAFPLATKYAWMQQGRGAAGSVNFGTRLAHLATEFSQTDARMRQALSPVGGNWDGRAASAATAAATAAASVVSANAAPATTGQSSSHQYGDSFTTTRNAIPNPAEVGRGGFWGDVAGGLRAAGGGVGAVLGAGVDYVHQLVAEKQADDTANQALTQHDSTSRTTLAAYSGAITGHVSAPPNTRGSGDQVSPGHGPVGGPGGAGSGGAGSGGASGVPGPTAGAGASGGGAGAAGSGSGSAAGGGPGSGAGGAAGPGGGTGSGGSGSGAGGTSAGGLPTGPAVTTPSGWTPLNPVNPTANPLVPGPNGGLVPPTPGYQPPASTPSFPTPALPPLGTGGGPHAGIGAHAGAGYAGGYGGAGHPLAERGGPATPAGTGRPGTGGGTPGGAATAGERAGGAGGMPMGGMGGAGRSGQDKDHRNNIFIPDDEPFRVEFDDLSDAVIGPDDDQWR
jgi:hypothetical protein